MVACCVEDCSLTDNDNVILFEFPTSRLLRKRWLDAINPRSKLGDDARVCSRHFTRGDYEEFRGKTRLKGKVVPTRFGNQVDSHEESSQESKTESNKDEKTSKGSHNDKLHNEVDKSQNDVDKPHNDNDKSHNDVGKLHNENDKSHNDNDNSHNNSDSSDKSDSDTDYDIRRKKRKRGRPKRSKNTKRKATTKYTTRRTRSENKNIDNNDLDSPSIDKDMETTKDNHNDKPHNETDKSDNDIDNNEKDNCKKSIENGCTSEDSFNSRNQREKSSPSMPADIEDIISKYQIENKKTERQLAAMAQELLMQAAEPVFIEMQVSQGPLEPPSNDCLMLLESVQVEVDPTLMLEARAEDEECMEQIDLDLDSNDEKEEPTDKKPDQEISLLTSSDEDDVIIQEPKIDTVEVSDETDEDDVPLVKLVKAEKKTSKQTKKKKKSAINQILWKGSQDVYCLQCRHVSENRTEHKKHMQTHSKVIQICQDCGFTTCSKSQLYRHRRKHKNDKRHKCPLCNYSARHNMSLIYHLKTHRTSEKEVYMCNNCDFVSPVKSVLNKHKLACKGDSFMCSLCDFIGGSCEELRLHEDGKHKKSKRKVSDDSNSVHSLDDDSTNAEDDD